MLDHKVIGYVAALPRHQFFAQNGALLVTGVETTLHACIASRFSSNKAPDRYEYRKVRYRDLDALLERGMSLVLDRTAYERFAEAAVAAGRHFKAPSFDSGTKVAMDGIEVVKVSPNPRKKVKKAATPPEKTILPRKLPPSPGK